MLSNWCAVVGGKSRHGDARGREHGARLLNQARLAAGQRDWVDEKAFTRASAFRPTVFAIDVVALHAGKLSTSSREEAESVDGLYF